MKSEEAAPHSGGGIDKCLSARGPWVDSGHFQALWCLFLGCAHLHLWWWVHRHLGFSA